MSGSGTPRAPLTPSILVGCCPQVHFTYHLAFCPSTQSIVCSNDHQTIPHMNVGRGVSQNDGGKGGLVPCLGLLFENKHLKCVWFMSCTPSTMGLHDDRSSSARSSTCCAGDLQLTSHQQLVKVRINHRDSPHLLPEARRPSFWVRGSDLDIFSSAPPFCLRLLCRVS